MPEVAPRLRRPLVAAALIAPLVATAGVAVFAAAPRSPIAYCRAADPFFGDLGYSGAAHRSGKDDTDDAQRLADESRQARPESPSPVRGDWNLVHAAAVRLNATGLAAAADEPQATIDAALQHVFADYRKRCAPYLYPGSTTSLDLTGLVGQPPAAAYCQRAGTLFTEILANRRPDPFVRDRLVSEARSAVRLAPAPLAGDWASTLDSLVRLQRTGFSADAGHPQDVVDAASGRLYDDYQARCPKTPG